MNQLNNKVAIITGGADGMGKAAVHRFVNEGAKVVLFDIQPEKGAAIAATDPDNIEFFRGDVREEKDFREAVHVAVERFGGLDIMYHNAGVPGDNSELDDLTVEGWDDTFAVLLRASFLAVKCSAPAMRARGGGSIILTSSVSAYNLKTTYPIAYPVAKGAVIYLTRIAALKLAKDRIRVNAIAPGGVATAIQLKNRGYDQKMSDAMSPHIGELLFSRYQPFPQEGRGEDIAAAALFLASDESRWVTGIDIPIDGGLTLERGISDADYVEAMREAETRAYADLARVGSD